MLKAFVFQLLESIVLSSHWFQMSSCSPPYVKGEKDAFRQMLRAKRGFGKAAVAQVDSIRLNLRVESALSFNSLKVHPFQRFRLFQIEAQLAPHPPRVLKALMVSTP